MEKAIIRSVTKEDIFVHFYEVAVEVECGSHFNPSNPRHDAWLRRRYARHEFCGAQFFASYLKKDVPVGYAILLIEEFIEETPKMYPKAELMAIGVYKEYRGMGYGTQLLDYAEKLALKKDVYSLYISTYSRDHQNIDFYGKNGYIPVATLPFAYGPTDDGQVYVRKIIRNNK